MGKARYRPECYARPNEWLDMGGAWEYGDYRCCYLTIYKADGKFVPAVNGCTQIGYPNGADVNAKKFSYDTFDEASNHLFKYVDYLRDTRDKEQKINLQRTLHRNNPHVYPAV